ncbi:MAG: PAS domain S-box protein [Rubrobacteraceae bacterium]
MNERLRVLLVEDSEDDALLLARELKRGGYEPDLERVYTAPAMEEALDRREWDIVISDHSMPAFSSSMALELLRRKGRADMPFVIVSGKIGEDAAVAAMRAGAHDYVMKDNLARLNTAIERELREAENRRERRRAREDLRKSEERYRTFIAQSTEGIWRAELEEPLDVALSEEDQLEHLYKHLVFAECNDAMARMYGFERAEELLGLRLADLIPPDIPENIEYLKRGVRSGYRITDAESHELDRWGNPKFFLNNFVGIIEGGRLVRVWGTQRDITESKRAQEALREAEEKYRGIFENSVEGIYQSTVDGKLLTANPAMARMLGYDSPEELMAEISNAEQLYAEPSGREEFRRLAGERESVHGFEVEMRRRDGGPVWTSIAGRVVRGPDGEPVGYEGTIEDVTARKEAEEALKQSEAIYRSVVENAAENIFVVDVESKRILEANEALEKSLGYSAEELRAMTLYDLVAHEKEDVDRNVERILAAGSLRLSERFYRRKDGTFATVEVGVSIIPYGGREAMCVVAHDITERKRAEKALGEIREAERRRISRDLHDGVLQDLTYTFHSMQLERRIHGDRRAEEGKRIETIRRAIEGLRDAIYDLRIENVQEQTLTRSIESLVELNRQMTPERAVEFSVEEAFPEDLWGPGAAEAVRVLQEALVNVRRHSGADAVRVRLKVEDDEAVLEVSDDGKGFEGGSLTGVGLSSMRERAEALGGSLEVESGEGEGTSVVLRVGVSSLRREVPERSGA